MYMLSCSMMFETYAKMQLRCSLINLIGRTPCLRDTLYIKSGQNLGSWCHKCGGPAIHPHLNVLETYHPRTYLY